MADLTLLQQFTNLLEAASAKSSDIDFSNLDQENEASVIEWNALLVEAAEARKNLIDFIVAQNTTELLAEVTTVNINLLPSEYAAKGWVVAEFPPMSKHQLENIPITLGNKVEVTFVSFKDNIFKCRGYVSPEGGMDALNEYLNKE